MARIKEISLAQRPREKALREGIPSLSNEELLCLLLCSGTNGHPVKEIASELTKKYPTIYELSRVDYASLTNVKGLSEARALTLLSTFELIRRYEESLPSRDEPMTNSDEIVQHYRKKFSSLFEEEIYILYLRKNNTIAREETLERGESGQVRIHEKKLLKHLFLSHQDRYILIHNHPSGDIHPSREDIASTVEMKKCTEHFGFQMLDHIIIGGNRHFSFKKNGLI